MYAPFHRSAQSVAAPSPWVPPIHPEETFFSFAARVIRLACVPSEQELVHTLFGPGHRYLDHLVLDKEGAPEVFERRVRALDIRFKRSAFLEHSIRALALPFRPSNNRSPGFSFRQHHHHSSNVYGMRGTHIRRAPAFCPVCVSTDVDHLGYSYWRRTPQIAGANFCPTHMAGVVDRCIVCGEFTRISELPDLNCTRCSAQMVSLYAYKGSAQDRVMLNFASTVHQVFAGSVNGPLNVQKAREHFETHYPKNNPVLGADFCSHIQAAAGEDYLQQLGLCYSRQQKFPWPTLIYTDRLVLGQASHQLLLHAALTYEHPNDELFLPSCPSESDSFITDDIYAGFEALWADLNGSRRHA